MNGTLTAGTVRNWLASGPLLDEQVIRLPQGSVTLLYFPFLIDDTMLQERVIPPLQQATGGGYDNAWLSRNMSAGFALYDGKPAGAAERLMRGWTLVLADGLSWPILIDTGKKVGRNPERPEVESQIFGPQVGYTESIQENLALMFGYLPDSKLAVTAVQAGERTKTKGTILAIDGVSSPEYAERLKKRVEALEIDAVIDGSILQSISDQVSSIFPQMIMTERPDRAVSALLEGKVVLLLDGSPFAIIGPCHFFDFFHSAEDQYMRWNMSSALRILRILSVILSVLFTPIYVACLTFHYQLIPSAMLVSLAQSRSKVPFPPLMEALFLEFVIELLREAGARLPTKVGQTIGIVGGIVIGQATVQAGFTSNILIIIVALGALSSFITPVYMMGAAIRIIRFPMILLAGIWGALGIMFGFSFLLLHLLRLSSLGAPYMYPVYPLRLKSFTDTILRFPNKYLKKRSGFAAGKNQTRILQPETDKRHRDIFETPDLEDAQ